MAGRNARKTWEKTRLQNLVRHKSGRYYVRAFGSGKEVWKSLKTSHFSVAEAKLAEFLKEHREQKSRATADAKMTFAAALQLHEKTLANNRDIKSATVHYWRQVFRALLKSWPELTDREIRRITPTECAAWKTRFEKNSSATRFNNTLAGLRHVFRVGIDAGVIYRDPTAKLKRHRVRSKQLTLPSRGEFPKLVESIVTAGAWCSRDCADLVQGMAFTGMRKSEASEVEWRDLLFDSGEVVVRGDPATGTKNWEVRRVPMIPEARELFQRMRASRPDEPATGKVFRVREAQKAIDAACRKLRLPRITHHDLRHLFATTCIESGIDIPTISRWLGHKDGGTLAMKTYGHLRNEHSITQAKRVSFASPSPAENVIPMRAEVA